MSLWLAFALMTAAAIFAVLWPLGRRTAGAGGSDIAVYRDQLEEVTRDRATGLIGDAEAEAAKVEVSRRLIAAADAAEADAAAGGSPLWRRRATALTGLLLLPIGAAALYLALGSPQLPGQPLAERAGAVRQDRSIQNLVSQVEAHLERNPNDARGYEVVAPVYLRLGRFDDAVNARRKSLALAGETAERQADLGEALASAANGVITVEAKAAFERALALDPNDQKAKFFIGVAAEQDGDKPQDAPIWT
jgi:cytochrome c-type biogenesis protein CcmH